MQPRKEDQLKKFSTRIPADFTEIVEETFNENFKDNIKKKQKFKAEGTLFTNEVDFGVSLITEGSLDCLTCMASCDYHEKDGALEKVLQDMIDIIGNFFDEHFTEPSKEYSPNWVKIPHKSREIWTCISKENLKIDKIADEFLAKHGFFDEDNSNSDD